MWYYFVQSIKVTPSHGVTLINNLLCKFTGLEHFCPRNKFQEVMENYMNVLHKGMQGFYSKFKYWNFRKTLKIDQSKSVSWYICI